ncbi:ThuA domain-containing protein [Candidatus Latescibacterota bacterium]
MKNKEKLSRRSALQTIGLLGAASALGTAVSPSKAEADRGNATAFAMIGDRWHSYDYIRTAFTRTFIKEAGLTIDFSCDYSLFALETLKKYNLLIMLMDGMIFPNGYRSPYHLIDKSLELKSDPPVEGLDEKHVMWMTDEQGKDLKEYVTQGGAALFYHNSSYISTATEHFRDVEGAMFTGHTDFAPYKMEIVNKDHPITKGVNDFIVTEEQHYLIYDKNPSHVLMRSVNLRGRGFRDQGTSCEACWAYEYGKGRVCFMAPGHTIPGLWNPEYVKLQKNAAKWLLRT